MSIGEQLRAERLRQGLSIRKLASLADVSKQTIVNVESGANSPKIETAEAIAKVLHCTIEVKGGE